MSRYLVTGATGFLGRHLVRTLLDRGDAVVALVRKPADLPAAVTQVTGDVLDPESIAEALVGCDGVFHCAGKVSRKPEDAEELYKLHVDGTKNVLAAMVKRGVLRVVVASTSGTIAVGDDPDRIYTEEDSSPIGLLQRWPYYRSKLFAEMAALEQNGKDGLEVVCVNPTLLLGPGDVNGSSTEDVRLFLERKIPAIPPGGLSYVDARDAALAMALAMDKGIGGRRYLIGACNLTIKEFFARLERVSGVRGPILPMPRQAREIAKTGAEMLQQLSERLGIPVSVDPVSLDMAHFYWYLDASLAESELGWAPRDPTVTLVATVRDLEERGVVWPQTGGSFLSTLRRRITDVRDEA
ncbi:MAG: NAD-dependent epimerase/dehydratase family protein [Labilithrix sp.]|nr:NAD-dependent epimerase/dehydratase family protein [Labilithrix sp.]MCW5811786.1 NAD-dependent epimerase/dehydratase family protein [Labilithrix sp.]